MHPTFHATSQIFDVGQNWHRVLLLRQIKSILRAKKSFSICIEVA